MFFIFSECMVLFEYLNMNVTVVQVRWKGYDPDEDTWEPIDNLRYAVYILECPLLAVGFRN